MRKLCPCMIALVICLSTFLSGCGGPTVVTEAAPLPTATPLPATSVPAVPTETPSQTIGEPTMTSGLSVLTLTSSAFKDGAEMADKYTYQLGGQCNGDNLSPGLEWSGVPAGTQSLALTVIDPDGGNWVHWLQFNLPAETTTLSEAPGGPDIGLKGKNSFGSLGYGGPCPPSGTHHYIFTLYALDSILDLQASAKFSDFENAIQGHILAQAQLTGLRTR